MFIIGVLPFKRIREIPKKFRCFCCTELSYVWNIFKFFITILNFGPVYRNTTKAKYPRFFTRHETTQFNFYDNIQFNFYDTNPTPTNFFSISRNSPVFLSSCLIFSFLLNYILHKLFKLYIF